jgi:hypothetical protein
MRESDAHVATNRATIAKEREAHDAAITQERTDCMRRCAMDMEEVAAARKEADTLKAQATADAAAAAALMADYEKRVALIRQAGV